MIVDLGTGNSRVILASSEGELLGSRTFTNPYYRDGAYEDAQYFKPEEWQEKILRGCRELCEEFPDVAVDGVTSAGARQSFVLFDRQRKAFLGLPNIDNRGRAYMREIPDQPALYRISGKWVTEDTGAAKLYGFRKKYPQEYEKIGSFTSISEWIAAIFTGRILIEPSQACESQLYDLRKKAWSDWAAKSYRIDRKILPGFCRAGEPAGRILPEYRQAFHMKEEAIFVAGGADTQAAVLQTGLKKGEIAVVSGTTTPVVARTAQPLYEESQTVWVDADLRGDAFLIEMNPGVTGLNYQRAKTLLAPDVPYDALEAAYEEKKDFACTASFTSLLFYQQRSLRRGGFFMRSPLEPAADRVDMLWAVLADIACATWEQMRRLCDLTGNRDEYFLGCGGGFRSRTLCKMMASLSGRELRIYPGYEQATAQGLITLCNRAFGKDAVRKKDTVEVYVPETDNLIHEYYPVWLENRNRANLLEN